jgi:hypothetical protein
MIKAVYFMINLRYNCISVVDEVTVQPLQQSIRQAPYPQG